MKMRDVLRVDRAIGETVVRQYEKLRKTWTESHVKEVIAQQLRDRARWLEENKA